MEMSQMYFTNHLALVSLKMYGHFGILFLFVSASAFGILIYFHILEGRLLLKTNILEGKSTGKILNNIAL